MKINLSQRSPNSLAWAIAVLGSGAILWSHFFSGLLTLILLSILILLIPRIPFTSTTSRRDALDRARNFFLKELGSMNSHRLEGMVFGYATKLGDEISRSKEDLFQIEGDLQKALQLRRLLTHSLMTLNVIFNAILVTSTLDGASESLLSLGITILLPLVIIDSISRLLNREFFMERDSESTESR